MFRSTHIREICRNQVSENFEWDVLHVDTTVIEIRVADSRPVTQAPSNTKLVDDKENLPCREPD